MMPILKWLALRASETLGIATLTPTYALWECGHLARLVDFSLAAKPP
jgi:hypothetical protein